MVRVERGNVVLKVEDEEVQHYLNLGYNVTDSCGNIITQALPRDFGTLMSEYIKVCARVDELEATVAKLTAELTVKQTKPVEKKETVEKKSTEKKKTTTKK